jgi:hypothetical protein
MQCPHRRWTIIETRETHAYAQPTASRRSHSRVSWRDDRLSRRRAFGRGPGHLLPRPQRQSCRLARDGRASGRCLRHLLARSLAADAGQVRSLADQQAKQNQRHSAPPPPAHLSWRVSPLSPPPASPTTRNKAVAPASRPAVVGTSRSTLVSGPERAIQVSILRHGNLPDPNS